MSLRCYIVTAVGIPLRKEVIATQAITFLFSRNPYASARVSSCPRQEESRLVAGSSSPAPFLAAEELPRRRCLGEAYLISYINVKALSGDGPSGSSSSQRRHGSSQAPRPRVFFAPRGSLCPALSAIHGKRAY